MQWHYCCWSKYGTATTAAMGAMVSNANSKEWLLDYYIQRVTAVISFVFYILWLILVDYLSKIIWNKNDDWAMKLAVFHTLFNF